MRVDERRGMENGDKVKDWELEKRLLHLSQKASMMRGRM